MRGGPAGIPFALHVRVWTDEDRLEHYCRMGLLAVMILHWIVFALLVGTSSRLDASGPADVSSNLASIVASLLLG